MSALSPDDMREHIARLVLAGKIADRMAEAYRHVPVAVARACDVDIDGSGNLLGWLREYAALKHSEGA